MLSGNVKVMYLLVISVALITNDILLSVADFSSIISPVETVSYTHLDVYKRQVI